MDNNVAENNQDLILRFEIQDHYMNRNENEERQTDFYLTKGLPLLFTQTTSKQDLFKCVFKLLCCCSNQG